MYFKLKSTFLYFFFQIRLLEEFVNHIQELQVMDERIQRKVEKLEQQCQKEAKEFAKKVQELQKSNQVKPEEIVSAKLFEF